MVGAAMLRRHCLALLTAAVYDACHVNATNLWLHLLVKFFRSKERF